MRSIFIFDEKTAVKIRGRGGCGAAN